MSRIIVFMLCLCTGTPVYAGDLDVGKLLGALPILTDPTLTDEEKLKATVGALLDQEQEYEFVESDRPKRSVVEGTHVLVSLRPQARSWTLHPRRLRQQLRAQGVRAAVVAVCGNGIYGLDPCKRVLADLRSRTSNCVGVAVRIVELQHGRNSSVPLSLFRSTRKNPRDPTNMIFATEDGQLQEFYPALGRSFECMR